MEVAEVPVNGTGFVFPINTNLNLVGSQQLGPNGDFCTLSKGGQFRCADPTVMKAVTLPILDNMYCMMGTHIC